MKIQLKEGERKKESQVDREEKSGEERRRRHDRGHEERNQRAWSREEEGGDCSRHIKDEEEEGVMKATGRRRGQQVGRMREEETQQRYDHRAVDESDRQTEETMTQASSDGAETREGPDGFTSGSGSSSSKSL